jgi:cytochrome oxidase Cu insertion factor (SCO1/SenC/PrrC family)/thiol-disulfide isomerase/thioredoxin
VQSPPQKRPGSGRRSTTRLWLVLAALALAAVIISGVELTSPSTQTSGSALASNPELDSGTPLSGAAPDFTLVDQFGKRVSLHSFRGKVVILAFNDSECTTICPLTTTAMLDAKAMLGSAARNVQLLGIDANPTATSLGDVRAYSELHGMVHQWHFLTGSPSQLKQVWKAYKIGVAIEQGQIDHTPALFVIDTRGRLARLYLTQQSYAAVGQLGQLIAQEASRLLPGHPRVHSRFSYAQVPGIPPTVRLAVPRAGGKRIALGPSGRPRLYLFFATWDQEVTNLAKQLQALDDYSAAARSTGLPPLTAVDEASVESSPRALPAFLRKLSRPLSYPVAIDNSGRIAWYDDVSTDGWLARDALERQVRNALVRAPAGAASAAAAQRALAGSPGPLAALHQQADQLLGGASTLAARIRALRGYPVVLNAWGSWCVPCRQEFGLFAVASVLYGRRVAFLGADVNDDAGDAHAFLAQHPVSYPSYQMASSSLTTIVPQGLEGTPTTIFFNRLGKIVHVHTGQYESQGSLDGDIAAYTLGG